MSNDARPIPRELVERMKAAGGTTLTLSFCGGSDEGFLDFTLQGKDGSDQLGNEGSLERDIDAWAWEAYSYSGTGDDFAYGDNYEYDFEAGKASHEYWQHEPVRTAYGAKVISYVEA